MPCLGISDEELFKIFLKWARNKSMASSDVVALVNQYLTHNSLNEEQLASFTKLIEDPQCNDLSVFRQAGAGRVQGTVTQSFFLHLKKLYDTAFPMQSDWHPRPPFLGFWVNLIPGNASYGQAHVSSEGEFAHGHVGLLMQQAMNAVDIKLSKGQKMSWFCPHHTLVPTAVGFSRELGPNNIEVRVSCDGKTWVLIYDSSIQKDAGKSPVAPVACRFREAVSWVSLRVESGVYSNKLRLHGYVQSL